ncbi:hypothetical protein SYK_11350 [Pseudodesulfovibrio nedwellii]|uniref:Uncharacterized protein n=1 Tax=Pseudodesulfovibrio nedwellii TaxID=2973072 RepID=A0ABN6S4W8_9BACT|nr:hypothetical protein SYK_11350 [Pseudodesulfovibrio nedwellii]
MEAFYAEDLFPLNARDVFIGAVDSEQGPFFVHDGNAKWEDIKERGKSFFVSQAVYQLGRIGYWHGDCFGVIGSIRFIMNPSETLQGTQGRREYQLVIL